MSHVVTIAVVFQVGTERQGRGPETCVSSAGGRHSEGECTWRLGLGQCWKAVAETISWRACGPLRS